MTNIKFSFTILLEKFSLNKFNFKKIHHRVVRHSTVTIGVGGVWIQLLEGQGARALFILVLRECIWNMPAVSLVLPAFNDTGSLGSLPHQVDYPLV